MRHPLRMLGAEGQPGEYTKSPWSLEQRRAEHEQKLPHLERKSPVQHEIGAFRSQIRAIQQFMIEKGMQ
jgi:hypothetical protein